ncbi:hypothetical protein OIO90_004719 [Microbotryomycetes sp. JL221]|nr:hypothetical protein OIO90_004719 [Microbotryomycetes sp. JL221]
MDATISARRRPSRLVTPLLLVLVPAFVVAAVAFPILAVTSLIPIIGFFSLPTLLSFSVFLLYSTMWILYLSLAQLDRPPTSRFILLPLSPIRAFKITLHTIVIVRDLISSNFVSLLFDLQLRRVLILGGKDRKQIIKDNVLFGREGRRLDVYYAVKDKGLEHVPAPVVVFVGGGNWTWWSKGKAAQIALRLRRLGFVVVVPQLRQWGQVKTPGMVTDLRLALEWVGERIKIYGGDDQQIQVMGFGSGAHIASLTIIQDAVVRSRDEHLMRVPTSLKGNEVEPHFDVSAGIRRCRIWGDEARLPSIKGVICVSGVFDVVKQLRFESKQAIEDISALRRACGPSTSAMLQSCPSHLLYGAKELIDPTRLPSKWLLIAGGRDRLIPYSQSVLLRLLLVGVGVQDVRLKLYKDETHMGSLASLMHQTRYSSLFLSEIEALVADVDEEEDDGAVGDDEDGAGMDA